MPVNQPLDRLSVLVGGSRAATNSARTRPVIGEPSALRATGTVMVTRLLPGSTSGCQPNQISV